MNCKPGDLAVIVEDDFPENIGKLVHVIEAATPWPFDTRFHWAVRSVGQPLLNMVTDADNMPTTGTELSMDAEIPDADLRPIRPGDITDEEVRDLYAPSDERVTC